MKLTDVIAIWDKLRVFDTNFNIDFCDFEKVIEAVVDVENDVPGCQPTFPSQ